MMTTFNTLYVWPLTVYTVVQTLVCALIWLAIRQAIRTESRRAVVDYGNRLKARQVAASRTPYDEWCADLHKELGRE